MYRNFLKRLLDLAVALAAFILLFIPFLIISLLLYIANQGKPFFTQQRPGKNEKLFKLLKFRTMNEKRDKSGQLLPDVDRVTAVGHFLRKTSLDEIPQLLNVIKGDMSLVGPRPLLPAYLPHYNDYHRQRHKVRPGITGLAQTAGRNNLKFSERFNLDVEYVQRLSFLLDCKLLWATFLKVFKTSDVVLGRSIEEVDDLGITKNLASHYFKKKS